MCDMLDEKCLELISIVVPIYNVSQYIERCVDSILAQTYENIEIILVDDGSVDGSDKVCDCLAEKCSNIYVIHKSNGGITSARKNGLAIARGSYVGFVDPDDWIENDMYETLLGLMETFEADLVCSGMKREGDMGVYATWKASDFEEGTYKDKQMREFIFHLFDDGRIHISGSMCNKLFKTGKLRECLHRVDDRLRGVGDDTACVIPYLLESRCIHITNKAFYHGCERSDSATHSKYEDYYFQANITYNIVMKSIDRLNDIVISEKFKKVWTRIIVNGLNHYFDNKYEYRLDLSRPEFKNISSIVIYGAGCVGKNYYLQLEQCNNIKIVAWLDQKFIGTNEKKDIRCSVSKVRNLTFDKLIIAIYDKETAFEIKDMLMKEYGIPEELVFWAAPISVYEYGLRCGMLEA